MCGIAGLFHRRASAGKGLERVERAVQALGHRGPDDSGVFQEGPVCLGHSRLSIIDLASGNQPMVCPETGLALVFNGEIYNYLELRDELSLAGHTFRTNSDTEVLMEAYRRWGRDCVRHFNGMWAFAIWDPRNRQVLLSRDRFGEKPLFYAEENGLFYFGSEIKALAAAGFPLRPSMEAVDLYLNLKFVPAPFTFYRGIHLLLPGHNLIIREDLHSELQGYYEVPVLQESERTRSEPEILEQFESLLKDAVRLRTRSDVPYGAFLSGGLDSSSITALLKELEQGALQTFTIGFDEPAYDESTIAARTASFLGVKNYQDQLTLPEWPELVDLSLSIFDQPFGDSSFFPTGAVSRLARKNVKVVLTGDGGDEVMAGYTIYQGLYIDGILRQLPEFPVNALSGLVDISSTLLKHDIITRAQGILRAARYDFPEWMFSKFSGLGRAVPFELYGNGQEIFRAEDFLADCLNRCPYEDAFNQLNWFQLKYELPDDMLTKVDRMTMSVGLEARLPFLDYRLVELMSSTSSKLKLKWLQRKRLLRKIMRNRLPPELFRQPKRGFSAPLNEWFAQDATLVREGIRQLSNYGFKPEILDSFWEGRSQGGGLYGNFLWSLYVLSRWLQKGL